MAKGKHAASAANRRAKAAEERADNLDKELQALREESRKREQELKAEVQNLKGRITHRLDDEVSAAVSHVKKQYEDERRELRKELRHRSWVALRILSEGVEPNTVSLARELWRSLADATEIPVGEILELFGERSSTRAERRISNSKVAKSSLSQSLRDRGVPDGMGRLV